jgi:ankyrin repeat protein
MNNHDTEDEDYTEKEVKTIFLEACKRGKLDFVKFFMHDKELKNRVNLKKDGNDGLILASDNNHGDIVDYLLEYKEITSNLSFDLKDLFLSACTSNLVRSLSPLIKYAKKSNLELPYDKGFSSACTREHVDILTILNSHKYIRDAIGNDFMLKQFDLATKNSREPVIKFFLTNESLEFRINSKYYFHKISGFNPTYMRVKVSSDSKPFLDTYHLNNDLAASLTVNHEKNNERPKKRLKI